MNYRLKNLCGAFGRAGHSSDQIFHAPGAKPWHYAAGLRTLSVTNNPFCGSVLTDTTDNLSEKCPIKLTDRYIVILRRFLFRSMIKPQSYTGSHIPLMAFTSVHDPGMNFEPQVREHVCTSTTQPIQLACT